MQTRRRAQLRPIGVIRSVLKARGQAPMQGSEGAPDAWLEVRAFAADGLDGLGPIEAIDGTPVVDIKPVLAGWRDF